MKMKINIYPVLCLILLCTLLPLQASSKLKNPVVDKNEKKNHSRVCMKVMRGTEFYGEINIRLTEYNGSETWTKGKEGISPTKEKCIFISPYWKDKKEVSVMLKKSIKCGTLDDEELSEKGKKINFCASGTTELAHCRRC